MSTKWTKQEAIEAFNEVMKRSTYDKEFRKLALENGNEAIKIVSGKELPENQSIRFIETPDNSTEVYPLPRFEVEYDSSKYNLELSDDQLDDVVGGSCFINTGCFIKGCYEKFF